jgi:hypothetical protein
MTGPKGLSDTFTAEGTAFSADTTVLRAVPSASAFGRYSAVTVKLPFFICSVKFYFFSITSTGFLCVLPVQVSG